MPVAPPVITAVFPFNLVIGCILGVSDKVLIQSLKDLEADQVLARNDYKEVPPRVDYTLTPLGRSLAEAIMPLCRWGTENAAQMAVIFAERNAVV